MSTTAFIEPPASDAADEPLDGFPPLLSVVPQAGPAVFVYVGFGLVLLLLLVPPLTLVVTLMGVALVGAAVFAALVALAGAIVAAPFLLVRRLHWHPLRLFSRPVLPLSPVKVRRV